LEVEVAVFRRFTQRWLIISALAPFSLPLNAIASSGPSCQTRPTYELRLHVVDDVGAQREVLDVAATEAGEIWERVGLHFTWTFTPTPVPPPDGRTVIVVLRRELSPIAGVTVAATNGRVRRPLGWVVFDAQERPGHLIEVSFDETRTLVNRGVQLEPRLRAMPDLAQLHMLGRGLGRVIAHEIGHWLMGRGHVESGLMKARFGAADLVEHAPLSLPKTWVEIDRSTNAGASCAPVALQRLTPVTVD
jgi:hypothetical protein